MISVLITLTTAGSDTGPFNLYSNIDGYTAAFETNITKADLLAGYTSNIVPNGTTIIRVMSNSVCNNYSDFPITITTSTTTNPFAACLDVNPTFDSNLDGWTGGGADPWFWNPNYGGCASYPGSDSGGYITQNILTVGKTYLITLNYTIVNTVFNGMSLSVVAGTTGISFSAIGTHSESFALTCTGNTYFTINGFIESGYEPGIKEINLHDICVVETSCSTYSLHNSFKGMITVEYNDCNNEPATVDVYDSDVQICAKPGTVVPQTDLTVTEVDTLCHPESKLYINNNSSNITVSSMYFNFPTLLELDSPGTYPINPSDSVTATYLNGTYFLRFVIVNSDTLIPSKITVVDSAGIVRCQDAGYSGNLVIPYVVLQDSYPGNNIFTVTIDNGTC